MDSRVAGLVVSGLEMSLQGGDLPVRIDLVVQPGELVGLFGRSGAGKSTLFKTLMGILPVRGGSININGHDIQGHPVDARARLGLGYVPQNPALFFRMTVRENLAIAVGANVANRASRDVAVDRLCHALALEDVATRPVGVLSGGERRRCEIGFALAPEPKTLLLDEPFSGLDPINSERLSMWLQGLSAQGTGILMADHRTHEALAVVDRFYLMQHGTLEARSNSRRAGMRSRSGDETAVQTAHLLASA